MKILYFKTNPLPLLDSFMFIRLADNLRLVRLLVSTVTFQYCGQVLLLRYILPAKQLCSLLYCT